MRKVLGLGLILGALVVIGRTEEPYNYQKREATEWANISIAKATSDQLPRVLLIGDSISSRYSHTVGQELKDKAYLSLLATSKPCGDPALIDLIKWVLRQNSYAVIHFNNGLHSGAGYTVEDYRQGFPEIIATLKRYAPGAKLIWATTTPCRGEAITKEVRERNKIAAGFIEKEGIAVDDLYGLVTANAGNPKVLWDAGGTHYTEEGAALQGRQVARSVLALLPAPSP